MKFWSYPSLIFGFRQLKKKQDASIKVLHNISNSILLETKTKLSKNITNKDTTPETKFKSFINILVELSQTGALSDTEVREQADTIIASGSDTSSEALTFAILLLGANPEVQEKLYKE